MTEHEALPAALVEGAIPAMRYAAHRLRALGDERTAESLFNDADKIEAIVLAATEPAPVLREAVEALPQHDPYDSGGPTYLDRQDVLDLFDERGRAEYEATTRTTGAGSEKFLDWLDLSASMRRRFIR